MFGATRTAAPDELASTVAPLNQGRGVDVVFELTGSPAAFTAAWPLARIGGTFVVVGSVFPSPPVELYLEQLVRRHLILRGIHNYRPEHLLTAVEFLAKHHHEFPFAKLVAEWHLLGDIKQALATARDPAKIRVGIRFEDVQGCREH
ncbi:MAG: zinc-binding dehydrogenase [Myxococcales bacterium]